MLFLLRKIRQKLLQEGKIANYLKYAIGEILLVVIGILIALQINTWHQNSQNRIKEKRYLFDLLQDIKKDSIAIKNSLLYFDTMAKSKKLILNYLNQKTEKPDSLIYHLTNQWEYSGILVSFRPHTTTIDELKNSSNLDLIHDVNLRRDVVNLYNKYDKLIEHVTLNGVRAEQMIDLASRQISNMDNPAESEVTQLLKDNHFANTLRYNYSGTAKKETEIIYYECIHMIRLIEEALKN